MDTERDDLAETLRNIASGSRRSKIVRLREIFDLVEEVKAKGASNKEIVAGLAKHGLIFDVPNFKNARSRILKERAIEALTQAVSAEPKAEVIRAKPSEPASIQSLRCNEEMKVKPEENIKPSASIPKDKSLSLDLKRTTKKFEYKSN